MNAQKTNAVKVYRENTDKINENQGISENKKEKLLRSERKKLLAQFKVFNSE